MSEGGTETSSIPQFMPQISTTNSLGPGQIQEPGAWSGAPHVGGKDPMSGPLSVAFPGAVAGSHFGSVDLEQDPAQQYGLYIYHYPMKRHNLCLC